MKREKCVEEMKNTANRLRGWQLFSKATSPQALGKEEEDGEKI